MYLPVEREIVVCCGQINVHVQEMKICLPMVKKIY